MQRPWHKQAEELEAIDPSPWNGFNAFETWFSVREDAANSNGDSILDELDQVQQANLYLIFCQLFDGIPSRETDHAK